MIQWKPLSEDKTRLAGAISLALCQHDHLVDFLFIPSELTLRATSDQLIRESKKLTSTEQLLIRIALDLWNSSLPLWIANLEISARSPPVEILCLQLQRNSLTKIPHSQSDLLRTSPTPKTTLHEKRDLPSM